MANGGEQFREVRRRLEEWRRQSGGRGRRIPAELWSAAAAVARREGVSATATALRLNAARLRRSMGEEPCGTEFVELDPREVSASSQIVVRLIGADGEQLWLELPGPIDLVALVGSFWQR